MLWPWLLLTAFQIKDKTWVLALVHLGPWLGDDIQSFLNNSRALRRLVQDS